jgi:2,4-dienoyl-CoA reductase (NADPH2)
LFKPIKINTLTLPNRIVMPAMHTAMATEDGFVTRQLTDFYVERAKGGAGLLVVGGISVEKRGTGQGRMAEIFDDAYMEGLTGFTQAIHDAGGLVAAQLYHSGRYAFEQLTGMKPVSSSAVYSRFSKQVPEALTLEGIQEVQDAFVAAARRAKAVGFDGVELLGSAGYIMDQFLSPLVNQRDDEYGGSLENRLRFPQEVIKKVRAELGPDYTMWMRMAGDDFVEGSLTYHDKPEIAVKLVEKGLDALSITGGWHETKVPQLTTEVPPGVFAYLSWNIKKNVNVPVFVANRINDPFVAEDILRDGFADCVCIGRTLIVDPYFPQKVKEERFDDIMKCVGCNQGCMDNLFLFKPIECIRNPRVGREGKWVLQPAAEPKKVLVVGGGPAGCEAAAVAAERGHNVLLIEKDNAIGGQTILASIPPGRHSMEDIRRSYEHRLKNLGVEVRLDTPYSENVIAEFQPDEVVVAVGVVPKIPPIKGIDNPIVCQASDVLLNMVPLGRKVAVIGGSATGIEVAIYIAQKGAMTPEAAHFLSFYGGLDPAEAMKMTFLGPREVHILDMLRRLGGSVGKSTRWTFLDSMEKLDIKEHISVKITEIGDDSIEFEDQDGNVDRISDLSNIILAAGVAPNKAIFEEIKASGLVKKVHNIGDSKEVGTMKEAVEAGFKTGMKI